MSFGFNGSGGGTLLTFADLNLTPQPFVDDTTIFALVNYSGSWNGGLFTYGGSVLPDGGRFTVGSQQWEIDYNRTSAAGLDNFTGDYLPSSSFVTVMAVPEPAALAGLAEPELAVRRLRGLVVIDEIQRRPELFPLLRVLADRRPLPARFLILGSASPELLR